MAAYDDLNAKRIFIIGILSIVVTAVTALAVQVVYYSLVEWHEADLAEKSSYRRQNKVLADQSAQISKYGVNPDTGSITIPIDRAMQLIAVEHAGETSEKGHDANHSEKHDEKHDGGDKHDAKHDDAPAPPEQATAKPSDEKAKPAPEETESAGDTPKENDPEENDPKENDPVENDPVDPASDKETDAI